MNAHAIDSPLKVLKAESMLTLQKLQQSVESYLEDPADKTALDTAADGAHQMSGVFAMLNEADASALMQEIRLLTQGLAQAKLNQSETLHEVLLQAVLQAPRYFEWLQMEGNKPAFHLHPLINKLRRARGAETLSDRSSASAGEKPRNKVSSIDPASLATRLRPSLQRALLGVLRGQNESVKLLASIFAKFKENASTDTDYRLWLDAEKLLREILNNTITFDTKIKLLLRELDHHVKQLIEKGEIDQNVAQAMVQRINEYLPTHETKQAETAECPPAAPASGSIVQLDSATTDPGLIDKDTLSTLSELLKEHMVLSQHALDGYAQNSTRSDTIVAELERLHSTANVLTLLNMEVPASLIRRHINTLRSELQQNNQLSPDKILQIASELILVQNALTGLQDFVYNEEMAASVAARLDDAGRVSLLMDFELNRARKIIAEQAIRIIDPVRAFATNYLTSQDEPAWEQLDPVFYHLAGTFVMLGCEHAAQLVDRTKSLIQNLEADVQPLSREELMSHLADLIVTFEHYLNLLADNAKPSERVLEKIEDHLRAAGHLISRTANKASSAEDTLSVITRPKSDTAPDYEYSTSKETLRAASEVPADDLDLSIIHTHESPEPRDSRQEPVASFANFSVVEKTPATTPAASSEKELEESLLQIETLEINAIFDDDLDLKIQPVEEYQSEEEDSLDFPDLILDVENQSTSRPSKPTDFNIESVEEPEQFDGLKSGESKFISSESIVTEQKSDDDTPSEPYSSARSASVGFELDPDIADTSLTEEHVFQLDDDILENFSSQNTSFDKIALNPSLSEPNGNDLDATDFDFADVTRMEGAPGADADFSESSLAELIKVSELDNSTSIETDDESDDDDAFELAAADLFETGFSDGNLINGDDTDTDTSDFLSFIEEKEEEEEETKDVGFAVSYELPTDTLLTDTLESHSPKTDSIPAPAPETDESFLEPDPELLEIFFEEAQGEVVSIDEQLRIWRSNLADADALNSIRRSFHTLKGSGRMVGETTIGEFAWAFEQLLNRIIEGRLSPSYAATDIIEKARLLLEQIVANGSSRGYETTVAKLVGEVEALRDLQPKVAIDTLPELSPEKDISAPAAGPADIAPDRGKSLLHDAAEQPDSLDIEEDIVTTNQFTIFAPDADPELVEVFIYEAADILDSSEFTLQRWSADPLNQELMNNLRRDMHTLKGSSRMAGLLPIGDLAHAAESVLDAVAKGDVSASVNVTDTLQQALDGLSRMLNSVKEGDTSLIPANHLITQLSNLLGSENTEAVHSLQQQREVLETLEKTDDQEFLEVFLYEATEILEACDTTLRRWSTDPSNQQLMNDLRREMHTLKGSSRMAGVGGIGDAAQSLEELFDSCLQGEIEPSATVINSVQQSLDMLDKMLVQIKNDVQPENVDSLIGEIRGLILTEPADPAHQSILPEPTDAPEDRHTKLVAGRQPSMISSDTIRVDASLLNNLINQMGESSIYRARVDQGVGALRFNLNELDQTLSRLRQQMRRLEIETEAQILFRYEEAPRDHKADFDPLELDRFAELQQLSRSLMEVVDDLTNIQNSLEDQTQSMGFLLDQQNKVNKDIQQGLMRTSMVRFSTVVPRLRRVVRQAAQELGRRAQLVIEGSEAEIDRTVLDNMVAPLEHMLRNAISHGIESPGKRGKAGKPETGTITLSLRREGSELVIELSDDGSGLDYKTIQAKGEASGFLQPGQALSESDLINLLLRPGFSTATEVTQISGRGVGLDVLNDAIRTMRGALQIQSKPGQGTTFIIRLPFSLAVTQALLVKAGTDTYAVPMLSLEAVDRLKEGEIAAYMAGETVKHGYGNHNYPLHSLGIMFGDETSISENTRPSALLFRSAEASAALQVDEIVGHQEIIVKPVGPQLHNVPGISGATVLGDGRVVVVLELAALVRKLTSQAQQQMEAQALRVARQEPEQSRISAMVIDDSITMRKVTARFLGRHHIDVKVAKDGIEAVAMLEEQVPDFAILDIEMPRMDGFEVVAHVRNQPHLKDLPIIMVTSRSGEKHRTRAARLGVNDYLIKPYQEEEMMASIQKVLNERGLELPV